MTFRQATSTVVAGAALALAMTQPAGAAVLTTAALTATATEANTCNAVNVGAKTITTILVEVVDAQAGTVLASATCNGLLPSQSCGAGLPLGAHFAFCRFTPSSGAKIRANQLVVDGGFEVHSAGDAH